MSDSEDEEVFDDEEMSDDSNSGSIKDDDEMGSEFNSQEGSRQMQSPRNGIDDVEGPPDDMNQIQASHSAKKHGNN